MKILGVGGGGEDKEEKSPCLFIFLSNKKVK